MSSLAVDTCTSVSIQDILAGKYKDVQLVTHSQHDGWVRKGKSGNPVSSFPTSMYIVIGYECSQVLCKPGCYHIMWND